MKVIFSHVSFIQGLRLQNCLFSSIFPRSFFPILFHSLDHLFPFIICEQSFGSVIILAQTAYLYNFYSFHFSISYNFILDTKNLYELWPKALFLSLLLKGEDPVLLFFSVSSFLCVHKLPVSVFSLHPKTFSKFVITPGFVSSEYNFCCLFRSKNFCENFVSFFSITESPFLTIYSCVDTQE